MHEERSLNSKRLKHLQKQCDKLLENDIQGRIDNHLEFGNCYRDQRDYDSAIVEYLKADELSQKYSQHLDSSFACRALCEIYAETNYRRGAIVYSEKFRNASALSQDFSQIQLSFHVSGWVLQRLWVEDSGRPKELLEDALRYVKKSISFIYENASQIDTDSKAVASGGDSKKRKAHAERLYASIAGCLGYREESLTAWNRAFQYAQNKDADLKYDLLLSRIDFQWENKHVEIAQQLVNHAPEKKKGAALLELSQAFIFEQNFSSAQKTLYDCLNKHMKNLTEFDQEVVNRRLIFLHKYFTRLQQIENPSVSLQRKRKCFEHIADSFIEFSDDRKVLHSAAIDFYQKMLECSSTVEEKMPAIMSLAETHKDVGNYHEAAKFFATYQKLEEIKGVQENKQLETRGAVFITKCLGQLVSDKELKKEYEHLKNVIGEKQLYLRVSFTRAFGEYIRKRTGNSNNEYLELANKLEKLPGSQTSSTDSDDDECEIEDDEMKDMEIMQMCRRNALKMNNREELIKMKDTIINNFGETKLHEASRNVNTLLLEELISLNYNVDFQDFGGWTPLHEAVSYGNRENVLRLLKAKANVNIRSKVSLENESGSVGGGITPLMDACQSSFLKIANDLILYGADISLKNEDGWTALDFLRASIQELDDDDDIADGSKFLLELENRFREKGIKFSRDPPTRRRSSLSNMPRKIHMKKQTENLSPSKANLSVYKSTMGMFSKNPHRKSQENVMFHEYDALNVDSPSMEHSGYLESYSMQSSEQDEMRRMSLPRMNSSNHEDFIDELDSTRKRKSSSTVRQNKKSKFSRSVSNNSMRGGLEVFDIDDDLIGSPDSYGMRSSPQWSTSISQRQDRNFKISQRNTQRSLNLSCNSTPPTQKDSQPACIVTVTIKNPDGSIQSKKKMKFSPTDKVREISVRCRETLPEHQHNFIIKSSDGCELEDEICLGEMQPLEFDCEIHVSTTEMILKSKGVRDPIILKKLKEFDVTGRFDIADIEVSTCVDNILNSISESSKRIKSLDISYCDSPIINEMLPETVHDQLDSFHADASCISHELIEKMAQQNLVANLKSVFIPFTKITDGLILSNLFSSEHLTKVDISGVHLRNGVLDMTKILKRAGNLKYLDISYSPWLTTEALNNLLHCDSGLEELVMNGNELLDFQFELTSLLNLKKLSLTGCIIDDWDSLLEWVAYAKLEFLDLSSTKLDFHHVDTLISSRNNDSVRISVRAVRCLLIEEDVPKLSGILLNHIDCAFKPLFDFSCFIQTNLRKISAFADSFLISQNRQ